ncbi:MAG: helix-turn-helix transcriptional regulator [Anaerolineae bacterium]|jgi:AraC-like DNA-binding protein|nr:helix-turn-helix transcriptional regulator [Anaerolineae bacterium]
MNAKITAIYSAIEFIEKHLKDEISVGDIAASAGYSLYHFIRVFNQTVQHSPYDYLIRRRLSEAALELRASDRRIIDISMDYCFQNHETFSRAFKRMFAVQPSQWRSKKNVQSWLLLPRLSMEYLRHINKKDFLYPKPVAISGDNYVRFVHGGTEVTLHLTLNYIYHSWFPQSEIVLAYAIDAKHFEVDGNLSKMVALIPILR